jgi:pilus assembly protein CpaB
MNRSRLLMIAGLAIAVGLLASYSVYSKLRAGLGGSNEPGVDVVVAADDLQVGAKLGENDVRLLRFPQSTVPPGAYGSIDKVLNRGVILPIGKGEFILPSKLAAANAGAGLASMIPQGMRAVSVRVNDVVSVAGFVQPGSRVDVLSTSSSGGNGERQTTTVLENVAVIAVGKNLTRNTGAETQTSSPMVSVITLLVSPDDAQKLALASQEGRIQLALRNPLDTHPGSAGATKASSLYPGSTAPQTEARPRVHRVVVKSSSPPASRFYSVETIRGNKKDETKFEDQ